MYSKDELKNLKLEFWESFAAFCEVQPYLRGRKKIWTLYDTKVKGVELKFDATREGAFVILEVNHRGEEARLEMFERLTWYKDTLETDFPEGLTWDICFVRVPENRSPVFIPPNPGLLPPPSGLGRVFLLYGKSNVSVGTELHVHSRVFEGIEGFMIFEL